MPRAERSALERQLGRVLGAGLDEPAGVVAACAEVRDWPALFDCARRHELLCALYDVLRRSEVEIEPDLDTAVRREAFIVAASQQPLRGQLDEVLEALDRAGVRVVALKGPLLAERIYPSVSLRQSVDLDVLVTRDDVDRAVEALGRIGYFLGETEAGQRYVRRESYQLILLHPERRHIVELHFRALRAFGSALDAETLVARAVAYEPPGGRAVLVLSPEDELLYLAVHAAKHFRLHLKWLYDIVLFARRYTDLDVGLVASQAREAGVERGLAHALGSVERFFGVAAAGGGRGVSRARARAVAVARGIGGRFDQSSPPSRLLSVVYSALLADTAPRSLAVLRHGLGRMARRRAHRYAPWLVPDDWSA